MNTQRTENSGEHKTIDAHSAHNGEANSEDSGVFKTVSLRSGATYCRPSFSQARTHPLNWVRMN